MTAMRLATLALAFLMLLPGCAAVKSISTLNEGRIRNVTPAMVYKLQEGYDVARVGLVAYRSLPWCQDAAPPCQQVAAARQIKRADAAAMLSLAELKRFSDSHDVINASAAYDGAVIA